MLGGIGYDEVGHRFTWPFIHVGEIILDHFESMMTVVPIYSVGRMDWLI